MSLPAPALTSEQVELQEALRDYRVTFRDCKRLRASLHSVSVECKAVEDRMALCQERVLKALNATADTGT